MPAVVGFLFDVSWHLSREYAWKYSWPRLILSSIWYPKIQVSIKNWLPMFESRGYYRQINMGEEHYEKNIKFVSWWHLSSYRCLSRHGKITSAKCSVTHFSCWSIGTVHAWNPLNRQMTPNAIAQRVYVLIEAHVWIVIAKLNARTIVLMHWRLLIKE